VQAEEYGLYEESMHEVMMHRRRIGEAIECLDREPDSVPCTDQLIYRFSKLQDAMGKKLFRAYLSMVGEMDETMTMIDVLNKLEKWHLLERSFWKRVRDIRNEIAHNYDDDPEVTKLIVSQIKEALPKIDEIISRIEESAAKKRLL